MRTKVTWLILAAVAAVVVVGVIDAVRGGSSKLEAAQAGQSVIDLSTPGGGAPPDCDRTRDYDSACHYHRAADATETASEPTMAQRLRQCDTEQLRLAFTLSDGVAAVVLRRVEGSPCHHGRAPPSGSPFGMSPGTVLPSSVASRVQLSQPTSRTGSSSSSSCGEADHYGSRTEASSI
jgi:hypothetical protein